MKRGCRIPDHLVLPVTQVGGRFLIWGAIWTNGRTELHIQRENMNYERYVQVLERFIYPLMKNSNFSLSSFLINVKYYD